MRSVNSLMGLVFFTALVITPSSYAANSKIEKVVNAYLAGVTKVLGGIEEKAVRKAALGDLDSDGDKDLVVAFLLQNNGVWTQHIAAFRNNKGTYSPITDAVTGSASTRYFTLEGVLNQRVIGITEACASGQPQGSCPTPSLGTVSFTLVNNQLVERR